MSMSVLKRKKRSAELWPVSTCEVILVK